MSRRFEELQEKAEQALAGVKATLKSLRDRERQHVILWLLKYFEDDGAMKSPQAGKPRRRVVIDGQEFWLVRVVQKKP
jgi:hypothetical protein